MTADAALRSIAFDNVLPGKRVVIFGSGDSGLLAARQISISGDKSSVSMNQSLIL